MLVRANQAGYYNERVQDAGSVFSFDMKHAETVGKGKNAKPVLPTWIDEVKKSEVTKDEKDAAADAVEVHANAKKAYDSAVAQSEKLESDLQNAETKEAKEAISAQLKEANDELSAALADLESADTVLKSL